MEGYKVERRGKKKKKRKRKAPPPSKFANAYYDTTSPAAFTGSARRLAKEVEGATERQAREWLRGQDTYTLHKQARRRFSHESIYLEGLDYQWSADLLDVQAHAHENDGVRYLLTVIDGLSKHAWVRPLMNKSAATVAIALEDVFVSSGRQPQRLRTDKGTEFLGQPVQKMLSRRRVVFFTAQHSTKASLLERFNRTLRGKLSRYFTATNAHRYLPVLEDLVRGYNHTVHTTTKMKPADVNALNQHVVWKRMFGNLLHRRKARWVTPPSKAQFKVGDLVRIAKEKGAFEKAYLTNWTSERFIISKVILTAAGRYKYLLEDLSGEPLIGTFQKEELQKVTEQRRQIQRVVKRTPRGAYVRWRGHPNSLTTLIQSEA